MKNDLISVVMSVFNAQDSLDESISSLIIRDNIVPDIAKFIDTRK